jgi:hypothetical protein
VGPAFKPASQGHASLLNRDRWGARSSRQDDNKSVRHTLIRVALFVSCMAVSPAQVSSTVSLSNGVQMQITTKLGQPAGQTVNVEMVRASGDSFYRIFRDQNSLAVFAYELVIHLDPSGNRLRAVAKPAETEFAARFPNADGGKPTPTLSADQDLGAIGSGQSADIPLFELEGMGIRVVDTIRLKMDDTSTAAAGRMRLSGLKIYINRAQVPGSAPSAVAGKFTMLYIPGRGGYFFSAEAVPDRPFSKAGTIDGNRMLFDIDNESYEAVATAPILSNPDSGELWVYHDPTYKPSGNWTQNLRSATHSRSADLDFFVAASDSLSWWLPQ